MEGWNTYTLNDICTVITDGSHFSPREDKEGCHLIATVKDMNEYGFDLQNCKHISKEDYASLVKSGCQPEKNDVLYSKDGTIGIVQLYKGGVDIVLLSSIAILRCNTNLVSPRFLSLLLRSSKINQYVSENYKTGSALPRIVLKDFRKIEVEIPPLLIQQRIAEILGALDDKIELNHQMNQTIEQMTQALYKQYFIDGVDPENLPKGWKYANLGDCINTISKTHKFPKSNVIFLNTSDIFNGFVLHSNYSEVESLPGQAKKSIRKFDILYSEIRPMNKRFAYVNFNADDYVVSTKLMVLRPKTDIDSIFFYFLLTRPWIISELQNQAEARSGTFPQITFNQIKEISFLMPDRKFLDDFIEKVLIPNYELIYSNSNEIKYLTNLRDYLLPKFVSSEINNFDLATIEQAL